MKDGDFIRLGLLRCISPIDSGRHFLQTTDEVYGEIRPNTTYFTSLQSSRRTAMLEALEEQSYAIHCETMAVEGIDYLKQFPQLNDYTIEAADGHFMDHACHTPTGPNGKVYAAGFIYAMNLRNGLFRPLCCITLRRHIEQQNSKKSHSGKSLYVYDKAVTDYTWWNGQNATITT